MSIDPIRTHFVVLCNTLNVGNILPYLRAERMVTPAEYETLSSNSIPIKQRRERLLLMMPKKGSDYFKNFGNCLVWSGQRDLAKHISVDVGAVPPCPHQETLPGQVTPQDHFQILASLMTPGGTIPPGMSTSSVSPIQPPLPGGTYGIHRTNLVAQGETGPWISRALGTTQYHPSAPPYFPTTHPHQPEPYPPPHPSHSGYPMTVPPQYQPYTQQHSAPPPPMSSGGDTHSGPPPPSGPPKVFILYHKDRALEKTYHVSTIDLIDKIKDMADILNSVRGFKLSIDLFHEGDVGNWGSWTERKIEESRYVVLLCSPRLATGLRNPSGEFPQLDTDRGSFFTSSVVNLINSYPHKFIPIFLSNFVNVQWIPPALATAPRYVLDIDNFVTHVQSKTGTEDYYRELSDALGMAQFEDWERLVRHLRGTSHEVPTPPSAHPLQPTGLYYPGPAQPSPPPALQFTQNELDQVAEAVSSDWHALGIRLGVSAAQLDTIDHQNSLPTRAAIVMLDHWRRLRGQYATRSALKGALLGLSFGAIATRLFEHD